MPALSSQLIYAKWTADKPQKQLRSACAKALWTADPALHSGQGGRSTVRGVARTYTLTGGLCRRIGHDSAAHLRDRSWPGAGMKAHSGAPFASRPDRKIHLRQRIIFSNSPSEKLTCDPAAVLKRWI